MAEHIDLDSSSVRVLLAAPDTLHFSVDIQITDELHEKLEREKLAAQDADKVNAVYCPDWLGAQVLPHGARGGYGLVLESDDFSIKVPGKGIPNRPGLFVELRSHFLHTHPEGPQGACEEALCWIRNQLLYDQDEHWQKQQQVQIEMGSMWTDNDLVFPNGYGGIMIPHNITKRSFKRYPVKAGLSRDVRFHDLRHTAATLLLASGINVKEMLATPMYRSLCEYAHVLPHMQQSAVAAMDNLLASPETRKIVDDL